MYHKYHKFRRYDFLIPLFYLLFVYLFVSLFVTFVVIITSYIFNIVPGPADVDRDGPSFIGDPDMGFAGLRTFGPNLVHHTQLKVRSNIAIKNFMIVDTPGMIDSPTVRDHNGNVRHAVMDRGYDFENVVKWYAERADVILLFFDPDKPGTTGETLSILTNSLVGLDHKLHIILNKADQFTKIHDFARAYGSLCWNLSKVIQRKDLPRIYTMCLPKPYQTNNGSSSSSNNGSDANSTEEHALGNGLADLESTREDVVQEVLNAPKRRIDNEITRLTDSVRLLQMHLSIVDDLSSKYRKAVWNSRLAFGSVSAAAAGLTVSAVIMGLPAEMIGGVVAIGAGAVGGVSWWQNKVVNELVSSIVSDESMSSSFRRVFARQLANKDEGISATWSRVHEHLIVAMHSEEFKHLDKISSSDMKKIENIIEIEIPNLRRLAAPAFNKNI